MMTEESAKSSPSAKAALSSKKTVKKTEAVELPSNRQVLNCLYGHYGRPERIVKEVVKLYMGYTSPAGVSQGDWIRDGFQLGRVNIYTNSEKEKGAIFHKTSIKKEGKGSWFIGIKGNELKVWISGKLDATLKIEDK